jgi:hypothetical protein
MLPAAPAASVVVISNAPFALAVIVAVSPLEPVKVITLPSTPTSSIQMLYYFEQHLLQ